MDKQPPSVTFEVRVDATAAVQDATAATSSHYDPLQRTSRRRAAIKRPLSGVHRLPWLHLHGTRWTDVLCDRLICATDDEEDVSISDDSNDEAPRRSQKRVSKARAASSADARMPTLPLLGSASSPSQQSTVGPAFIKKRSSRTATSSAFR